jgi:hypothetical protein
MHARLLSGTASLWSHSCLRFMEHSSSSKQMSNRLFPSIKVNVERRILLAYRPLPTVVGALSARAS